MIDDDDADVFLDPVGFGEKVIYSPRDGRPREIYVVIEREGWSKFGAGSRAQGAADIAPTIEVWIKNHPTEGTQAIDTGGDTITLARRQGLTPVPVGIAEVMGDSTPSMWHCKMR